MTSSYSEKITKLKNALESVFVKKTDIQNNLTSTDTNKPLSANQGKVLDTNKVDKIRDVFTSVNQNSIFNSCPFIIKKDKLGGKQIAIDHYTVLKNFIKGKKNE